MPQGGFGETIGKSRIKLVAHEGWSVYPMQYWYLVPKCAHPAWRVASVLVPSHPPLEMRAYVTATLTFALKLPRYPGGERQVI